MLKQEGQNAGQQEVKKGGFNILNILAPVVVLLGLGGGIFYVAQNTMGSRNDDYAEKVQKMLDAKKVAQNEATAPIEKTQEVAKNINSDKS